MGTMRPFEFTKTSESTKTIRGNKITVYACTDGITWWYAPKGGTVINLTYDNVEEAENLESIDDIDCFSWLDGVNSVEDFLEAVYY